MSEVRAAIIGLAWGQMHLDALRRIKGVEVVAVCDTDAARAEQVAKNAKVPKFYRNYEELLQHADVDLVCVATPPQTQKEIGLKTLAAKKALLLETPAGLTAKDARSLYDAAQARASKQAVAFQTRYLPSYAYAKELIEEEYLGRLLRASITFVTAEPWGINGNWAADETRGGGVLSNVAIHFIDALQWWFGPVEAVMAERDTLFSEVRRQVLVGKETRVEKWRATADDAFLALLKFANGGLAILNFLTGARQNQPWSITLVGSRATLQITSGALFGKRDTERDFGEIEIPRRFELPDRPREPLMWALRELMQGLIRQLRGEKEEGRPLPNLNDALQVHNVMAAIKRSSDDMMWVSVT